MKRLHLPPAFCHLLTFTALVGLSLAPGCDDGSPSAEQDAAADAAPDQDLAPDTTADVPVEPAAMVTVVTEGALAEQRPLVVFHDAAGEPVHTVTAGAEGEATYALPDGGWVSVVADAPASDPGETTILSVQVAAGERIVTFDWIEGSPSYGTLQIAPLEPYEDAWWYHVDAGCREYASSGNPGELVELPVNGSCVEPDGQVAVLAFATATNGVVAYSHTRVAATDGGAVEFAPWQPMPAARVPVHLTGTPEKRVRLIGLLARGEVEYGTTAQLATRATPEGLIVQLDETGFVAYELSTIPDFFDTVRALVRLGSGLTLDVIAAADADTPLALDIDAEVLAAMSALEVDVTTPSAPVLSWETDSPAAREPGYAMVTLDWAATAHAPTWTAHVALEPSQHTIALPRLPSEALERAGLDAASLASAKVVTSARSGREVISSERLSPWQYPRVRAQGERDSQAYVRCGRAEEPPCQ